LYFSGGVCKSKNRLDGKTAIITGSNTGIGYETALDFAKRGAHVILACRDLKKAQKSAHKIIDATGNSKIEVEYLDLGDLDVIRQFAQQINKKLTKLDLLVNNAALMISPLTRTKQGFELQFGTNHLGHFLLTNLLLDLLKKTNKSRIVCVSSIAHTWCNINWQDINWEKSYNPIFAYGQSKLANALFASELARRLDNTGVSVFYLHPGAVRTSILRYLGHWFFLLPIIINVFYPFYWVTTKSPFEGSQTSIHCSVSDEALNVTALSNLRSQCFVSH
jgi:NAD(P)-dependent dehydrogenase (short-subunit alcohol dehydrogenase family)